MFNLFQGNHEPTGEAVKPKKTIKPDVDAGVPNYLGVEGFGPKQVGQISDKYQAELKMTPPAEKPLDTESTEKLATPLNYLGVENYGPKYEKPETDEDVVRQKADAEKQAEIERIRQELLSALQSGNNIRIQTTISAGGAPIELTLDQIKSIISE